MNDLSPELGAVGGAPLVSTWGLLQSLGFQHEGGEDHLRYRHGRMILDAVESWSLRGHRVHLFGYYRTEREAAEIDAYLPLEVASRELGMAFMSYVLKNHKAGWGASPPPWFEEGLAYERLLPWVREREAQIAEYAVRPKCWAPRRWARLACTQLVQALADMEPETPVYVSFDGQVLVVAAAGRSFPMAATGDPWDQRYQIAASKLLDLPKRFREDPVEFSVGSDSLYVDRHCFKGVSTAKPEPE